ncbi:hypothetical protein B0A72_19320 [Flavobacterium pectinovorum]|uniref:Uncharacterized protein n=1 Tax=Flavobacterium pectinovorum TaxID=29533 RepID=A0AB36NWG7_9FLAO|nr:hypothetical protein B0A72_19320 [Flavobacterium pectinovorum]
MILENLLRQITQLGCKYRNKLELVFYFFWFATDLKIKMIFGLPRITRICTNLFGSFCQDLKKKFSQIWQIQQI